MIFTTDPAYASYGLEPDPGQQAEDAQLYRCVLHELIHIGTDLARLVHSQAVAHAQAALQGAAPSTPPGDHSTAFDRIARTIRRTITLARSLGEPAPPIPAPARPRAAARTPDLPEAGEDATPGRDGSTEAPGAGLRDRPETPDRDAPDRDEDVTNRPVTEVIAGICRDLGLDAPPGAHPWTRRTPADTRQPCTRAAAPGGAAATSPCQPGPGLAGYWPQRPGNGAAQRPSSPEPDGRDPGKPAATSRTQPGPIHAGNNPPDSTAPAVATILRHPTHAQERWRAPPSG